MIDSPSNSVIRSVKSLHDAKERRKRRQFVVEGVRGVEEGILAGYTPEICLYNEESLARTERGAELLGCLKGLPAQVSHAVSERALRAASDTVNPQGIVAVFPFVEREPSLPATPHLGLVLDYVQDPGNMGTLLRTAEAAGVHVVWVTPSSVDIYNPKVVRSAMGAHFRLYIQHGRSWASIVSALGDFGAGPDRIFCTDASAERPYDLVDWTLPSALVVSNEAHGLSAEAIAYCKNAQRITIPMSGGTESLNAAVAGAVVLFEAARQRRVHRKP